MKAIKITLFLFLCTFVAQAQEAYKHSLTGIKKVKVYTDTSIDLKVGTSNQFIISGAKNNKRDRVRNEKAKGLKALYSKGNDNTGRGLEVIKEGNTLIVKDLESFMKRNGFKIQIPKGIEVYLNAGNLGHVKVDGITSEIEIKTNVGHINLKNISGPVTVSTNTGDINAVFKTINQSSPTSLRSATGDVDVTLLSNTKANLILKTTMGTVFTNFDFKIPSSKGLKQYGNSRKIDTKLNNGGVKISLSSSTGNVYLRKK